MFVLITLSVSTWRVISSQQRFDEARVSTCGREGSYASNWLSIRNRFDVVHHAVQMPLSVDLALALAAKG
jgi:hypothetical protein